MNTTIKKIAGCAFASLACFGTSTLFAQQTKLYKYEGTALNTSRDTAAMNGIIMMPSTIPAVSMPIPIGGPEKSAPITGQDPRWSISHGSMSLAIKGAKTNNPHMP